MFNEVIDPGFMEEIGVVSRAGAGKDVKVREVLLGMVNDFHAGIFVIDGNDENFGFAGSGGVQEFKAGGIAVVALEPNAADEVDVVAVLFKDGGHMTGAAKEANDGMAKTSKAGQKNTGVIIFNIGLGRVIGFGGSQPGKDDSLQRDEKNR